MQNNIKETLLQSLKHFLFKFKKISTSYKLNYKNKTNLHLKNIYQTMINSEKFVRNVTEKPRSDTDVIILALLRNQRSTWNTNAAAPYSVETIHVELTV